MAEKAVQTVKRLIKTATHDVKDLHLGVSNIPWSDTIGSPVQHLMGRRMKTLLPTKDTLLQPKTINPIIVQEELAQR